MSIDEKIEVLEQAQEIVLEAIEKTKKEEPWATVSIEKMNCAYRELLNLESELYDEK